LDNKPKILHFRVFDCRAYVFFPSEVCTNKLVPHSKLIIFIEYENNGYCFIYHTQENIIFHSTHAIFDERLFPRCTNFHTKEYKLYDKSLNKINPETKLSVSDPSGKDRPAPVPTLHTLISPIQDNPPTHSSSPSLSYKSISSLPIPKLKRIMMLTLMLRYTQQFLQLALQTPQEDPDLRKSKC